MHGVWRTATVLGCIVLADAPATMNPRASASETIVVTNAWSRPALKGGTGVAYMTMTNRGNATVRIARATSVDATTTELHESTIHDGMAHMQPLSGLDIAKGESVSLKPGGLHFMLVGLRKTFVKGDSTRVSLQLDSGRTVTVNVEIRLQ